MSEYLHHVAVQHMGTCVRVEDEAWCGRHEARWRAEARGCARFIEATEIAATALRMFAEHDIHGVFPHGDISNEWYHRGIDGAQDEARIWVDDDE